MRTPGTQSQSVSAISGIPVYPISEPDQLMFAENSGVDFGNPIFSLPELPGPKSRVNPNAHPDSIRSNIHSPPCHLFRLPGFEKIRGPERPTTNNVRQARGPFLGRQGSCDGSVVLFPFCGHLWKNPGKLGEITMRFTVPSKLQRLGKFRRPLPNSRPQSLLEPSSLI